MLVGQSCWTRAGEAALHGEVEATVHRMTADERIPVVRGFARRVAGGVRSSGLGAVSAKAVSPKAAGKALRLKVPRSGHSSLVLPPGRPDAVQAVEESNQGRVPGLTPIRVGRMAATPFAFLRGSAGLMAHDLTGTPVTGVGAQLCGDAHAANFGLYGDARGNLVIDLNDFDETVFGPWEWDLKRLATSLVLAGREAGADEDTCRQGAYDTVGAYRRTMRLLAGLPALDAWNAIADEELVSHTDARDLLGTLERVSAKARNNTSARFAARSTEECEDGGRRFVDAPPSCGACPTRRPPLSQRGSRVTSGPFRRTEFRCLPAMRSMTSRSGWSARGAWGPGRTWCCCWTTVVSRWCCR